MSYLPIVEGSAVYCNIKMKNKNKSVVPLQCLRILSHVQLISQFLFTISWESPCVYTEFARCYLFKLSVLKSWQ